MDQRRLEAPPGFEPGVEVCRFRWVTSDAGLSCLLVDARPRFWMVFWAFIVSNRSRTAYWSSPQRIRDRELADRKVKSGARSQQDFGILPERRLRPPSWIRLCPLFPVFISPG